MKILRARARWNPQRRYWVCSPQVEGERRSFYSNLPGRAGQRECEGKAAEWINDRTDPDRRFDAVWADFLARAKRNVSATTYAALYSGMNARMLRRFGGRRISAISPAMWQSFLDNAAAEGLAQTTLKILQARLSEFISFCRDSRLPVDAPTRLTIPKNAAKTEKRGALQPEQLRVLFTTDTYLFRGRRVPCPLIHMFRFAVICGLRRGELVGLEWPDISEDHILTVSRAVNYTGEVTPGKNDNARRQFLLPAAALKVLADQRALLAQSNLLSNIVFPDQHGRRYVPNTVLNTWHTYCASNGLPEITFHEMRHTMISLYKASVPEELLKSVVGHSASMDTFGVYGHALTGEARQTADIMDKVISAII